MAALFDVRVSIVSGGILCVVGCALSALVLRHFRAYDERQGLAAGKRIATA